MSTKWFTPKQILAAGSPELPASAAGLARLIWREGWRLDPKHARRAGGRGGGWQYHLCVLPADAQRRLLARSSLEKQGERDQTARRQLDARRSGLWARYERLTDSQKQQCARRVKVLQHALDLHEGGCFTKQMAMAEAAAAAGVSTTTAFNWQRLVQNVERHDWLAALAPRAKGKPPAAQCHPKVWAAFKADWLRPAQPAYKAVYRRVCEMAAANHWSPVPSCKTLQRRLEKEIPLEARVLARKGKEAAKQMIATPRRSRAHFHAMQAVNIDGQLCDVFVEFEDGKIGRPVLLGIQDLYSGMLVAARFDRSENSDVVRLAIGDMVREHGIPEKIYLDNGRAFASKNITGGAPNRFRFKVRPEDPQGLLKSLGVDIQWVNPWSGRSKPIERVWRELVEEIARHPFCEGAYCGNSIANKPENYGSKAIPIGDFVAHARAQIARFNARQDRRTETARGRSFEGVFNESMACPNTLVRRPAPEQTRLWLYAADNVKSHRRTGEITLFGNRYDHPALGNLRGSMVTVRYDPENLHGNVFVYLPDGRFVCEAECIMPVGFDDSQPRSSTIGKANMWRSARCLIAMTAGWT